MGPEQKVTISEKLFFSPQLTEAEVELRQWFVREYLYDYNPVAAAMRVGFAQPFATEYAKKFMNESYVQRLIRELTLEDNDDDEAVQKGKVRKIESMLLREANYHGEDSSHGARVQALGRLVNVLGMEAPTKGEMNVTHRGAIFLIPTISNIEDWEATVVSEQEKLIDASRL